MAALRGEKPAGKNVDVSGTVRGTGEQTSDASSSSSSSLLTAS